jgi:hypothetical protein
MKKELELWVRRYDISLVAKLFRSLLFRNTRVRELQAKAIDAHTLPVLGRRLYEEMNV